MPLLLLLLLSHDSRDVTLAAPHLTPPDHHSNPDPPENCHLTVKKLPKILIFFKKIAIGNFFERYEVLNCTKVEQLHQEE